MQIFINWVISAIAIFLAASLLPGVYVTDFITALLVALILGVMNAIVKPVLFLLTLPITILTLGLFTFIVNAVMILLTDMIVEGFTVESFLWALVFSLLLSVLNSILFSFTKK